MAKFKTSISLADAVRKLEISAKAKGRTLGKEFYIVVEAFAFGRDVNGNTINKYRASLHCADLVTVENGYSDAGSIEVLTSPYRREQSDGSFFVVAQDKAPRFTGWKKSVMIWLTFQ